MTCTSVTINRRLQHLCPFLSVTDNIGKMRFRTSISIRTRNQTRIREGTIAPDRMILHGQSFLLINNYYSIIQLKKKKKTAFSVIRYSWEADGNTNGKYFVESTATTFYRGVRNVGVRLFVYF